MLMDDSNSEYAVIRDKYIASPQVKSLKILAIVQLIDSRAI